MDGNHELEESLSAAIAHSTCNKARAVTSKGLEIIVHQVFYFDGRPKSYYQVWIMDTNKKVVSSSTMGNSRGVEGESIERLEEWYGVSIMSKNWVAV